MHAVGTLWRDLVYAVRLLRRSPTFTASIVLTLALGVGVNTVVFSVVNAFILRPLPVRDGGRLTVIATRNTSGSTLRGVSFPDLEDYRASCADVFEDIAGYSVGFLGVAAAGARPERVLVTWVGGSYFPLLGIRPALGRLIRGDEGGRGRTDAVAVLGYSTWQRRFGSDASIVGKTLRVNGRPCTIVGVAPPGFAGTFAFSESEVYLPLNWPGGGDLDDRHARTLHAIARLRPRVGIEQARAAMSVVAERLARQHPDSNADITVSVLSERLARPEEDQARSNERGAAIMLALVGLVLIVAAVNVTNLLLARATARRSELAIRAALGAGRGRLVRQLLTESLVLAALGGAAGIVAGMWASRALAAVRLPGDLPVRFDFRLDGRVFAYGLALTLATALLAGLAPAIRAARAAVTSGLRHSAHGSRGGPGHRIRSALVVAQVALCFVLLFAAGLFVRSALQAERADLGFRADGVLNVHMDVGQLNYTEDQGRAFFDEIQRQVRSLPGVRNASLAFTVPMGYIWLREGVEAEGQPADNDGRLTAGKNIVSPEYFETMGIDVVRGRPFAEADGRPSRPVAIVNERLAEALWPGGDPIGRRFRSRPNGPWLEVIGVTATGIYRFLFEEPQPYFYVPSAQEYTGLRVLQLRTSMAPEALAPAVERVIRAREPDLPLYDVQSMTRALGSGLGLFPVRVAAIAAAAFGLLTLALALVGLYGVVSYLASQRAHEIGVRMAVGATARDIVRLVLRDGVSLVLVGLAAGVLIALAGARVLGTLLFGVSVRDPLTFVTVAPILGGVTLLACAIPAWRAARIDPAVTLRAE